MRSERVRIEKPRKGRRSAVRWIERGARTVLIRGRVFQRTTRRDFEGLPVFVQVVPDPVVADG